MFMDANTIPNLLAPVASGSALYFDCDYLVVNDGANSVQGASGTDSIGNIFVSGF